MTCNGQVLLVKYIHDWSCHLGIFITLLIALYRWIRIHNLLIHCTANGHFCFEVLTYTNTAALKMIVVDFTGYLHEFL